MSVKLLARLKTSIPRLPSMKLLGGAAGSAPAEGARRAAEADAWTRHRSPMLPPARRCSSSKAGSDPPPPAAPGAPEELGREQSEASHEAWRQYWTAAERDHSAGIVDVVHGYKMDWDLPGGGGGGGGSDVTSPEAPPAGAGGGGGGGRRWLLALRHGERVDLTFGRWLPACVRGGCYRRRDLNMPLTLPERAGGLEAFGGDTPLTRVGALQAALAGEGLRLGGVRAARVFASAALRCVETAHHMLKGMQAGPEVKICVEPGLFECKMWHAARGLPPFMTPREFAAAGYNVDLDYKPYVELDVSTPETLEEYYQRAERVIHAAVKETEEEGGNIIFVGHAATLDTMAIALRQLASPPPPRPPYTASAGLLRVPYCALAAARDRPYQVVPPPCPPCANSSSGRYDWRELLDE